MKFKLLLISLLLSGCAANQENQSKPQASSPPKELTTENIIGAISAGSTLSMIVMTSSQYCSERVPKNKEKYNKIYENWLSRNNEHKDMIIFTANSFARVLTQDSGPLTGDDFIRDLQAGVQQTTVDFITVTYASAENIENACEFFNEYTTSKHDIKNIKGYENVISYLMERYKAMKG